MPSLDQQSMRNHSLQLLRVSQRSRKKLKCQIGDLPILILQFFGISFFLASWQTSANQLK